MSDTLGSLIISLEGKTLTAEDKAILQHPLVGGVILFTRNYESRSQLTALCAAIRAARPTPLLIMVDQEGGRVQRFIPEFTRIPPMAEIGEHYNQRPDQACEMARQWGQRMAMELVSAGIDISLAPVLDLNKRLNACIGTRAFHADSAAVIKLATSFMRGMKDAGMAATGKHFPGHGSVDVDSHVAIPVDNRSYEAIQNDDLVPFVGLIQAGIPAIMAAHIVFPQVEERPVSYSATWLKTILRDKLGFQGVVLSDDLNMEGANVSANYADRVQAAYEAGCDFALVCNNRPGVIQVLDGLKPEAYQVNKTKWSSLKASPLKCSLDALSASGINGK